MDWAFTSCHTVLRASERLSHLSLTMKFQSIMCSLYRWGNWGPASIRGKGLPDLQAVLPPQAHRCVGPSAATVACWVCGENILWSVSLVPPRYVAHCTSQAPETPVPLSHREVHWASLLPDGAWQVENTLVKLLLNLCALIGPLRKDILPGDELWRMPSREWPFKSVKRVCTANLMALYSKSGGMFFSPKSSLELRLGWEIQVLSWSPELREPVLFRPSLLRNNLHRIKCTYLKCSVQWVFINVTLL